MVEKAYETVLLDAGGVLLDETQYERITQRLVIETVGAMTDRYSVEDYLIDLRESIERHSPHNRQYIIWKHCGNDLDLYRKSWDVFLEGCKNKDIIPAKQNGMGTVFVKSGIYRNQKPRTPDELPDLSLESTDRMAERIIAKFD